MERLAINVTPDPLKRVGFKVGVGFGNAAVSNLEEDSDEEYDE